MGKGSRGQLLNLVLQNWLFVFCWVELLTDHLVNCGFGQHNAQTQWIISYKVKSNKISLRERYSSVFPFQNSNDWEKYFKRSQLWVSLLCSVLKSWKNHHLSSLPSPSISTHLGKLLQGEKFQQQTKKGVSFKFKMRQRSN